MSGYPAGYPVSGNRQAPDIWYSVNLLSGTSLQITVSLSEQSLTVVDAVNSKKNPFSSAAIHSN